MFPSTTTHWLGNRKSAQSLHSYWKMNGGGAVSLYATTLFGNFILKSPRLVGLTISFTHLHKSPRKPTPFRGGSLTQNNGTSP